jgi:hypothetical protein
LFGIAEVKFLPNKKHQPPRGMRRIARAGLLAILLAVGCSGSVTVSSRSPSDTASVIRLRGGVSDADISQPEPSMHDLMARAMALARKIQNVTGAAEIARPTAPDFSELTSKAGNTSSSNADAEYIEKVVFPLFADAAHDIAAEKPDKPAKFLARWFLERAKREFALETSSTPFASPSTLESTAVSRASAEPPREGSPRAREIDAVEIEVERPPGTDPVSIGFEQLGFVPPGSRDKAERAAEESPGAFLSEDDAARSPMQKGFLNGGDAARIEPPAGARTTRGAGAVSADELEAILGPELKPEDASALAELRNMQGLLASTRRQREELETFMRRGNMRQDPGTGAWLPPAGESEEGEEEEGAEGAEEGAGLGGGAEGPEGGPPEADGADQRQMLESIEQLQRYKEGVDRALAVAKAAEHGSEEGGREEAEVETEGPNEPWGAGEDVATNLLGAPWGETNGPARVPPGETEAQRRARLQRLCDDANRPVPAPRPQLAARAAAADLRTMAAARHSGECRRARGL